MAGRLDKVELKCLAREVCLELKKLLLDKIDGLLFILFDVFGLVQ